MKSQEDIDLELRRVEASRSLEMSRYNAVIQRVLNMKVGEELSVSCRDLYGYFDMNCNPFKGENPNREIKRWLEFLEASKGIRHFEDIAAYFFRFKRFEKKD